jgi:hypothetical protein
VPRHEEGVPSAGTQGRQGTTGSERKSRVFIDNYFSKILIKIFRNIFREFFVFYYRAKENICSLYLI